MGRAVSLSSSEAESGVVMKEAVEGVLAGGGVSDGGAEEVMQGSKLEAESGSRGLSQCVMSLPAAEETLCETRENSSSEGSQRGREGGGSGREGGKKRKSVPLTNNY